MAISKRNIFLVFLVGIFSCLAGCTSSDFDIWKADRMAAASLSSFVEARGLYEKALTMLPAGKLKDSVLFKLGRLYFQGGDYAAAVNVFNRIHAKEAQRMLAISYFKDSDFTSALEVFNKNKDIKDGEYLFYYARTLEKSNLYDQALVVYDAIKSHFAFGEKARKRIATINLVNHGSAFDGVDADIVRLIKESPASEQYPNAGGLYLLTDENTVLTEDNRLESVSHVCMKVLNDRGKEKFAEVALQYDSTYERLEVEYARTIKPDGTVVSVGDKNIRDVSLYLNFPLYSNARMRIISMPEISAGCCIEYKIRIFRSKLPNERDFNTAYWLAADEPILLERFRLSIPADRALKYKIVNGDYNTSGFDMVPKEEVSGSRKTYSLEFQNVPQIIPEPAMASPSRINPYVLFSTFQDWQDIYAWWKGLYADKIVVNAGIGAKVVELIENQDSVEAKVRSIYNFCVAQIRYVAVEYGDAGYEPHKAAEVFENKYGDCKDKAILLVTMLKAAGIEAYPVLIGTFDFFDLQPEIPNIMFNHAIAAVPLNDKLIFMDATGSTVSFEDLPYGDQGRKVLVFLNDKYALVNTPVFNPEHNRFLTRMQIKVAQDESIAATRQVSTSGGYEQAQRHWLKYTMPSLIQEEIKQRARSFAHNAEVGHYEIKNVDDLNQPVLLKYSFSSKDFFTKAGRVRIMDQFAGIATDVVVKDTRSYPLEFSGLEESEDLIVIELPKDFRVKYLPQTVKEDNKWFSCLSQYELSGKNTIHFRWLFRIKERSVSLEGYPAYKKAVEGIALKLDQKVLLEKR